MKTISLILSIYSLILSFLPCGDGEDFNRLENNMEISSQVYISTQQEEIEYCSPFCNCTCCGMNLSYFFPTSVVDSENQPFFSLQNPTILYKNDSSFSNFFGNIWQPPKLA